MSSFEFYIHEKYSIVGPFFSHFTTLVKSINWRCLIFKMVWKKFSYYFLQKNSFFLEEFHLFDGFFFSAFNSLFSYRFTNPLSQNGEMTEGKIKWSTEFNDAIEKFKHVFHWKILFHSVHVHQTEVLNTHFYFLFFI